MGRPSPLSLPSISSARIVASGALTYRYLGDWLSDYVNVVACGADPTGATDSTSAINFAVNLAASYSQTGAFPAQGTVVYFPPGLYQVTAPIINTFGSGYVYLQGAGKTSTVIYGNFADYIISNGVAYTYGIFGISDMSVYNGDRSPGTGVNINTGAILFNQVQGGFCYNLNLGGWNGIVAWIQTFENTYLNINATGPGSPSWDSTGGGYGMYFNGGCAIDCVMEGYYANFCIASRQQGAGHQGTADTALLRCRGESGKIGILAGLDFDHNATPPTGLTVETFSTERNDSAIVVWSANCFGLRDSVLTGTIGPQSSFNATWDAHAGTTATVTQGAGDPLLDNLGWTAANPNRKVMVTGVTPTPNGVAVNSGTYTSGSGVVSLTLANTSAGFNVNSTILSSVSCSVNVVSGTYNPATGIVSLVLSPTTNYTNGTLLSSAVTGTGSDAGLLAGAITAAAGTGGTTLNYNVGTGKNITGITGGTVQDADAGLIDGYFSATSGTSGTTLNFNIGTGHHITTITGGLVDNASYNAWTGNSSSNGPLPPYVTATRTSPTTFTYTVPAATPLTVAGVGSWSFPCQYGLRAPSLQNANIDSTSIGIDTEVAGVDLYGGAGGSSWDPPVGGNSTNIGGVLTGIGTLATLAGAPGWIMPRPSLIGSGTKATYKYINCDQPAGSTTDAAGRTAGMVFGDLPGQVGTLVTPAIEGMEYDIIDGPDPAWTGGGSPVSNCGKPVTTGGGSNHIKVRYDAGASTWRIVG